jgi:hypothetical protein
LSDFGRNWNSGFGDQSSEESAHRSEFIDANTSELNRASVFAVLTEKNFFSL